jgi:hypothetical protein
MRPEAWEIESRELVSGGPAIERYRQRIEDQGISCMRCAEEPSSAD